MSNTERTIEQVSQEIGAAETELQACENTLAEALAAPEKNKSLIDASRTAVRTCKAAVKLLNAEFGKMERAMVAAEKKAEKAEAADQKKAEKAEAKKLAAEQRSAAREAKKKEKDEAKEAKKALVKPEKNGMRYPRDGSLILEVWELADTITQELGSPAPISLMVERRPDINDHTIKTQYGAWRKFHGITGRIIAPKTPEEIAAEIQAEEDKAAKKQAVIDAREVKKAEKLKVAAEKKAEQAKARDEKAAEAAAKKQAAAEKKAELAAKKAADKADAAKAKAAAK